MLSKHKQLQYGGHKLKPSTLFTKHIDKNTHFGLDTAPPQPSAPYHNMIQWTRNLEDLNNCTLPTLYLSDPTSQKTQQVHIKKSKLPKHSCMPQRHSYFDNHKFTHHHNTNINVLAIIILFIIKSKSNGSPLHHKPRTSYCKAWHHRQSPPNSQNYSPHLPHTHTHNVK